jgi:hypothetical protein
MHAVPETYKTMIGRANDAFDAERSRVASEIEQAAKRNKEAQTLITEATMKFLQTGIAEPPDERYWGMYWVRWGYRSHFNWHPYFRLLAKDTKRPFVFLQKYSPNLTISKRKYTAPLVASLLLAAQNPESGVRMCQNTVNWNFWFTGDNGALLLQHWKDQCAIDPTMRKALRLTQ